MRKQHLRHPRIAFLALLAVVGSEARAQQIKSRVMVLVDTSGSMIWHFNNNFSSGGDGDQNSLSTDGGQVLVTPGTGSGAKTAQWVDGVEDFRDNGSGAPRNGELRANGPTPLAGSTRTALNKWYQPILNFSRANPNCDPAQNVLCD